jgi:hypothetical protein
MLSDELIASKLKKLSAAAVKYNESEFSAQQEKALRYYNGDPMPGDDEEGQERRSKVVSRDVAEIIDWSLPDLVKIFVGSDNAVEFDAVSQETVDQAKHVTEAINHIFFNECDGFFVVHDQIKDGLLQKLGVVRVWWGADSSATRQTIEGVSEEALLGFYGDESIKVLKQEPDGDGTFTIRIEEKKPACIHVTGVAPENFLISEGATDEDDAPYIASRTRVTRSKLLAMGYDDEKIKAIKNDAGEAAFESDGRSVDPTIEANASSPDTAGNTLWMLDEFARIDVDEDGESELMRVVRVGDTVLHKEEVHEQDFVPFTPKRMPHRVLGNSLADDVMDIQEVKTALFRGALDNMAMVVDPQTYVDVDAQTEDTINDLLAWSPGGVIRGRGQKAVDVLRMPDISQSALGVIEYVDSAREQRTGVSRYNQGMDADSLNKTATGVNKIMAAGQQRKDLIARLYAETLRKIFQKMFKLLIRKQKSERALQIKGEWQTINPRDWNIGLKARPNVGLGTGDKTMQRDNALMLLQSQMQVMPLGMATAENIYNSLGKLVSALDMGEVESFFTNPAGTEPPPPPPDPEQVKGEVQLQLEAAKGQNQLQIEAAKAELKREEIAVKMEADRDKEAAQLEADVLTRQADAEKEALDKARDVELERERMAQERAIKAAELDQQWKIALLSADSREGDDGKVKSKKEDRNDGIMEALKQFSGAIEQMTNSSNDRFKAVLERMEGSS